MSFSIGIHKRWLLRLAIVLVLLLLLFSMVSCVRNAPWRTHDPVACPHNQHCAETFLELHEHYTLGFIEFSDRGNEFSREQTDAIINRLHKASEQDSGIAIIAYVHGWMHNASDNDANVNSFRTVLDTIGKAGILGERELHGVYIGWRGKPVQGLGSEFLSYWNRKSVAEHVGQKGVSPLIQRLSNIDHLNPKNLLLIAGHSFGGAMTLSAVEDILLSRMIEALAKGEAPEPLGEGVVLLNPATEANQALALREQSMRFAEQGIPTKRLLHVISSEGDSATHVFFPIGQTVASIAWNEASFTRYYQGKVYEFSEDDLDRNTIGNYQRFWTGSLTPRQSQQASEKDYPVGRWEYNDLCAESPEVHNPKTARLPCTADDPITFTITDASFIKDHGDIFNENVSAYLAATMAEAIYSESEFLIEACTKEDGFSFDKCFQYFTLHFSSVR